MVLDPAGYLFINLALQARKHLVFYNISPFLYHSYLPFVNAPGAAANSLPLSFMEIV